MAKKTDPRTKDELRDDELSAQQGKEESDARVIELEAKLAMARGEISNAATEVDPRLPVQYTDEYIQAREDEARAKGMLGSNITMGAEPFEKSMAEKGDNFAEGREGWEVADPFRDAVKAHCPEGHTPRYLSPKHIDSRGMRGWKFVTDKDGRQVRVANMLLGSMPNEKADQRQKYYQDKTKNRTRQTVEKHAEAQRQARAGGYGIPGNEIEITSTPRVSP